jgi:hypothetical protein
MDQGLTLCLLAAMEPQAASLFPLAKFHLVASSHDLVRDLNLEKCDAALIHKQRIETARSGEFVIDDCKKVKEGELEPHEAMCVTDEHGDPDITRDCKYYQVISATVSYKVLLFVEI